MAKKKITQRYWKTLERGSRERALKHVYPTNPTLVDMMLAEKPDMKSPYWRLAFETIKMDPEMSHYKTIVNGVCLP